MAKTELTGAKLDEIASSLAALPAKDPRRRVYGADEALTYLTAAITHLLDDGYSYKDVVDQLKERGVTASVARIKAIRLGPQATTPNRAVGKRATERLPVASERRVQGKLEV